MKFRTIIRLAITETRRSRGRLLLCLFAVVVGVASLTAVRTVVIGMDRSIAEQARRLMGADLLLQSNRPPEEGAMIALGRELEKRGARGVEITEFYSMLYRLPVAGKKKPGAPPLRETALVRVRALRGPFPFYGQIETRPAEAWNRLLRGGRPGLIADPDLASILGIEEGDRVRLGRATFRQLGFYRKKPGTPSSGFGFAPVIYINADTLQATGLLIRGSRIFYRRLFRLPPDLDPEKWKESHWNQAVAGNTTILTYRESASGLRRFLSRFSHFLTIVGVITLLLAGLGIGSALTVFFRDRLYNIAILRALGATPREILAVYLLLALLLGIAGGLLGVLPGALGPTLLTSELLQRFAGDLLPVTPDIDFSPLAALQGLVSGVIAVLLFTVLPVYRLRSVSPLRIMRRETESVEPADGRSRTNPKAAGRNAFAHRLLRMAHRLFPRIRFADLIFYPALTALLFGFVFFLTMSGAYSLRISLFFTAIISLAVIALFLFARLIGLMALRIAPLLKRYHLRQGVANLHRPGNQTATVITAIGLGVLLTSGIFILENSIQYEIAFDQRENLPNLFLVDIRPDQKGAVERLLRAGGAENVFLAPMISARLTALNGRPIDRGHVEKEAIRRTWESRMRTREYFVSYRDHLLDSEEIVRGRFWKGRPDFQEISVDEHWAAGMNAGPGDLLELDVQGIPVEARITSIRRIRWQALRPNAILLLSPGVIEQAPGMVVASFRLIDRESRWRLQGELVRRFPGISVIDMTETAGNVSWILERLSAIIRILGGVAVFNGMIIMAGAVATGRFARLREAMLLKVLGAGRRDLQIILTFEYFSLAALGALCGLLLSEIVYRPVLSIFFQTRAVVPYASLLAVVAGVTALNTLIGLRISRDTIEARPMDILRTE